MLASKDGGATPDVVLVANVEGGYTGNGELSAHSDHHWAPQPSAGSLLYALEVPQQGGDTSFYNMNLAYEALDSETNRRIESLQLITYDPFLGAKVGPRPKYRLEDKPLISPVFPHPLVRTHPDSGKRILYLDAATEVEVVGLPKQAGASGIGADVARLAAERGFAIAINYRSKEQQAHALVQELRAQGSASPTRLANAEHE